MNRISQNESVEYLNGIITVVISYQDINDWNKSVFEKCISKSDVNVRKPLTNEGLDSEGRSLDKYNYPLFPTRIPIILANLRKSSVVNVESTKKKMTMNSQQRRLVESINACIELINAAINEINETSDRFMNPPPKHLASSIFFTLHSRRQTLENNLKNLLDIWNSRSIITIDSVREAYEVSIHTKASIALQEAEAVMQHIVQIYRDIRIHHLYSRF